MDYHISTDAWARLYRILKQLPFLHTRNEVATRRFIEAIFFIARSGSQWRLLPPIYGHWRSVHRRYKTWADNGVWQYLMNQIRDIDSQEYMIDSTSIRAHSCSTGYKKDSSSELCLGRSAGGLTTKIHALCDALGNPVAFALSPGQTHDSIKAQELIEHMPQGSTLLADTAYDNEQVHNELKNKDGMTVIRPRRNRINPHFHDKHQYKERHLVECFFNKIKHFRRVFSRFDKSIPSFLGFIYFVGTLLWLR